MFEHGRLHKGLFDMGGGVQMNGGSPQKDVEQTCVGDHTGREPERWQVTFRFVRVNLRKKQKADPIRIIRSVDPEEHDRNTEHNHYLVNCENPVLPQIIPKASSTPHRRNNPHLLHNRNPQMQNEKKKQKKEKTQKAQEIPKQNPIYGR